ncbi:MAG: kinase/pyrophosphorylase [Bacteriovoracaceae bacterium]|nr:kinase/pyrophosphorylase [Bacteriovoracaceae bacterium]
MALQKRLKIIIISDGTGETATSLVRASMVQFSDNDIYFTRYKNIRTKEQIQEIFAENSQHHHLIAYTLVSIELRSYLQQQAQKYHVRSVDLLGPMLSALSNAFDIEPEAKPGKLHEVNDAYFKRVAAIEFTLNHDDGQNLHSLEEADIVLVGVSRTSKTPLSIYLSLEGLKVVNIPLVRGMVLPEKLFQIDQKKIFALTIHPETLHKIRLNRLNRLGVNDKEDQYADMKKVIDEIEWANDIFDKNKKWPVFNVSGKALEETASEIIRIIQNRKTNRFVAKE